MAMTGLSRFGSLGLLVSNLGLLVSNLGLLVSNLGCMVSSLVIQVSSLVIQVSNLGCQEVIQVSSLDFLVSSLVIQVSNLGWTSHKPVRLVLDFLGVIQVGRPDFLVDRPDFLVPFQQMGVGCLEVSSWVRLLGQVGALGFLGVTVTSGSRWVIVGTTHAIPPRAVELC